MAHLTLGELASVRQRVQDHRNGYLNLSSVQRMPGYNENLLRSYGENIRPADFRAEVARLRAWEDAGLAFRPAARPWVELDRAYREDDIPAVRAWESTYNDATIRSYLNAVRRRDRDQRARLFGMNGISGVG